MVGVAQLVELRIVIPVVAGSNPVVHPRLKVRTGKNGLHPRYNKHARVAELVDALVLGTSIVRCESSSLSFRTILNLG